MPGPFFAASAAFVCIFLAALAGATVRRMLPDHHLEPNAAETIKLVMGLVATIAAMVLGLLTATAQSSYATQSNQIQEIAVDIAELDRLLAYYGPETSEARGKLQAMTVALATAMDKTEKLSSPATGRVTQPFFESVARLAPGSAAQRFIQDKAFALTASLRRSRAVMDGQDEGTITGPFLSVLVLWLAALFFGFALFVEINATIVAAYLTGALSVASALFLILELDNPGRGLMAISSAPLRTVIAEIDSRHRADASP